MHVLNNGRLSLGNLLCGRGQVPSSTWRSTM